MDDDLRRRIEARAKELWRAAGAPKGNDLEFWLQAERECANLSVTGEEDPLAALDEFTQESPRARLWLSGRCSSRPCPNSARPPKWLRGRIE